MPTGDPYNYINISPPYQINDFTPYFPPAMSAKDFCYWLQGFFELQNPESLTPQQVQQIKDHLALVFNKVTPTYPEVTFNDIRVTC